MRTSVTLVITALIVAVTSLVAQTPAPPPAAGGPSRGFPGRGPAVPSGPGRSNNPFTTPIPATEGVVTVKFREFASLPPAGGQPARMNLLLDQSDTRRLFVNTMTGMLVRDQL